MTAAAPGRVLSVPAADPAVALRHFATRLELETDPSDVHADLAAGAPGLVVVDVRSAAAFAQGHVPGAVHLPHASVAEHGRKVVPDGATAVVHCWGPGCNGATRGALAFARLGVPVKEMIGGFEWWVREGLPVSGDDGERRPPPDPLVAVVDYMSRKKNSSALPSGSLNDSPRP